LNGIIQAVLRFPVTAQVFHRVLAENRDISLWRQPECGSAKAEFISENGQKLFLGARR